jgi:hypothetical protein
MGRHRLVNFGLASAEWILGLALKAELYERILRRATTEGFISGSAGMSAQGAELIAWIAMRGASGDSLAAVVQRLAAVLWPASGALGPAPARISITTCVDQAAGIANEVICVRYLLEQLGAIAVRDGLKPKGDKPTSGELLEWLDAAGLKWSTGASS